MVKRKKEKSFYKFSGEKRENQASDSTLIKQYEDFGAVKTAGIWSINQSSLYKWLRSAGVEFGKAHSYKGKTLEEIYGADRARKIRGRMSDGMRTYWENRIV